MAIDCFKAGSDTDIGKVLLGLWNLPWEEAEQLRRDFCHTLFKSDGMYVQLPFLVKLFDVSPMSFSFIAAAYTVNAVTNQ